MLKSKYDIDDIVYPISQTLVGTNKPCNKCNGTGDIEKKEINDVITCPKCNGTGIISTDVIHKYIVKNPKIINKIIFEKYKIDGLIKYNILYEFDEILDPINEKALFKSEEDAKYACSNLNGRGNYV